MSFPYLSSGRKSLALVTSLVMALVATSSSVIASPLNQTSPDQVTEEIATGELVDSTLTVTVHTSYYDTATLRVSGPERYALTKHFEENELVVADLITDRDVRIDGRRKVEAQDQKATEDLAPGRYNYEVVLHGSNADKETHTGSFKIW